MFQFCDFQGRASFDLKASYEQTWQRSTWRCYIPNIKDLGNPVSGKKKLNFSFVVPMFQFVTNGAGPVLTQGASYEKTWYRSTWICYIRNIKALGLSASGKKNFEFFLFCSYVPICDPMGWASIDPAASHEQTL